MPTLATHFSEDEAPHVEAAAKAAGQKLAPYIADAVRSRMQRDLSESTVMRNIGVALGHHHLASLELRKGLAMIDLDAPRCAAELSAHPELLSEAVQSVLRTVRPDDVYTELKEHTRGKTFGPDDLARIVAELPPDVQPRLAGLTPLTYLGDAVRICEEVVRDARAELSR